MNELTHTKGERHRAQDVYLGEEISIRGVVIRKTATTVVIRTAEYNTGQNPGMDDPTGSASIALDGGVAVIVTHAVTPQQRVAIEMIQAGSL